MVSMYPGLAVTLMYDLTVSTIVWQALWERLLSISDSVAESAGEERGAEALKPLVEFWMHTVRPQPDTLLSIDHTEDNAGGEMADSP